MPEWFGDTLGTLRYDGMMFDFDDDLLAHLQAVIDTKLRRGESSFLKWSDAISGNAIWVTDGVPISCTYTSAREAWLNPERVERLTQGADSAAGLTVTSEAQYQLV